MNEVMTLEELQQIVSLCLDEIVALKQEKQELESRITSISESLADLTGKFIDLYEDYNGTMQNIAVSLKLQDKGLDNIIYEINDPRIDRNSIFYPKFYDIEDTIDMIINKHCSMARFGDGELAIMAHRNRQKFQQYDAKLSERLKEVINVDDERFLVAIADNYGSLEKYSRAGKSGIRMYMAKEVREEHKKLLDLDRKYHNAYISRPCVLYADAKSEHVAERFCKLKQIWNRRNLILIEGKQTRMGVGNDLFDNAKSIIRILGPAENAYFAYDEILKEAIKYGNSESLYLIALGPTAGVLAYDLYQEGFQAIDIGHLDLEYEWYIRGGERCEVKGKYNNEYTGGEIVEDVFDEVYEKQIVARVD